MTVHPLLPAQGGPERRRSVRRGSTVDQARDLVAAQHQRCTAEEALTMLVDLAARMERSVDEVAADLLASQRQQSAVACRP